MRRYVTQFQTGDSRVTIGLRADAAGAKHDNNSPARNNTKKIKGLKNVKSEIRTKNDKKGQ